jgi:ABC-2 type transport system permease protein
MSELYWAASDSLTLIGRNVRHTLRSIDAMTTAVALPVMILLLFTYVFGGAIATPGGDYLDYVVPGIVLLAAGFGSASTAVAVCEDMTTGVVDRFRSMAIGGSAVLAGHVVASVLRNLVSTAVVVAVALVLGFDPHASALDWLGVAALLLAFMTAVSWLAACVGLVARSAEAANAFAFVAMFLPYVSSAFVPTATMPAGLRWFAEHQPVTPVVDAVRALTLGTPVGSDAWVGLAWCAAIALAGCAGAAVLFRRR